MRQGRKRRSSKEIDTSLPRQRVEMRETQNGKERREQPRGEGSGAAGV